MWRFSFLKEMKFINYNPSWRFNNIIFARQTKGVDSLMKKNSNQKILLRIPKSNDITKREYQNLDYQAKMLIKNGVDVSQRLSSVKNNAISTINHMRSRNTINNETYFHALYKLDQFIENVTQRKFIHAKEIISNNHANILHGNFAQSKYLSQKAKQWKTDPNDPLYR